MERAAHPNGYERTTLRQIAAKAKVSAATIVNYFGEKRDLLELLFNEEHHLVSEQASRELSEAKTFLDQSIDGFRHYYRYFGAHPQYARAIMTGSTFYDPAVPDPSPAGQSITRSISRIKRTVEIARKHGEITLDESDDALALLIYHNQCREAGRGAGPGPAKACVEHHPARLYAEFGTITGGPSKAQFGSNSDGRSHAMSDGLRLDRGYRQRGPLPLRAICGSRCSLLSIIDLARQEEFVPPRSPGIDWQVECM